jgi:hypothetical protein
MWYVQGLNPKIWYVQLNIDGRWFPYVFVVGLCSLSALVTLVQGFPEQDFCCLQDRRARTHSIGMFSQFAP